MRRYDKIVIQVSGKNHFDRLVSEGDTMRKGFLVILTFVLMIQLFLSSLITQAQSQAIIEVGKFSAATVGDTLPPD